MKLLLFSLAAALSVFIAGCKPKAESSKPAPPAKVVTENDLTSIVLKPEAEKRLGIETAPVSLQMVSRSRELAGELLLPLGRSPAQTNATALSGKSIYELLPAMTPTELIRVAEMQVDADGQIASTQVQLESARVALQRATALVANEAGIKRSVDEARAQVQLAEAAVQTARQRRDLLGAPLFQALNQDVVWVRVPIYAGDLAQVNQSAPARVSSLGQRTNSSAWTARPLNVPFSAAATSAAVDLYYEFKNPDGKLRPGQRVTVAVPLEGETESPVIPASALLYDIHGGTWVYENTAPQTFTRRRVEVRHTGDLGAVLARGPKPGVNVVIAGAAELFGTEFGIGK